MRKIVLSKTALIILLLVTSGTLAAVTSGVMMHVVTGPRGDVGPRGDTGPVGPKGDAGATGAAGPAGATGAVGATGLNGTQGPQGDKGEIGATGETGAPGPAGVDGSIWFSGLGVPASSLGSNGDYYLDKASDDLYNKALGTWTILTNIKGVTGETGVAGATGATGPQGPPGPGAVIRYNDTFAHSSISISTDYKTVSNVTLTAPSNGYLVLSVNAMAEIKGDSTVAVLGLGTTSNSYPELCKTFAGSNGGADSTTYWPMSLQTVVHLTEGNTYTFFANGYLAMAMHPADLYYIYMTGVFYPA